MKKKYVEPDLFEDGPLTPEKLLWLSLSELREGQRKLRKRVFLEFSALKKENSDLKKEICDLKTDLNQKDLFEERLFSVAK